VTVVDWPRAGLALARRDRSGAELLVTPAATANGIVELGARSPGATDFAAALAESLDARLLILDHGDATLARVARTLAALGEAPLWSVVVRPTHEDSAGARFGMAQMGGAKPPLVMRVRGALAELGIPVTGDDTRNAPIPGMPLFHLRRAEVVAVTVPASVMERFRVRTFSDADARVFARLGLPVQHENLADRLHSACPVSSSLPAPLIREAQAFAASHHPGALAQLRTLARRSDVTLAATVDDATSEGWLTLGRRGAAVAVALGMAGRSFTVDCRDLGSALARAYRLRVASVGVEP
jgi:hypothetical protein